MPERGLNKAQLIGRVGQDPELRYLPSGDAVATFSLATNKVWVKDGETQTTTEWHSIEAFRNLAEIIGKYVTKGQKLFIEGPIRYSEWQDQEGNTRRTTRITADNMIMLSDGKGSGGKSEPRRGQDDVPF